nr:hypothetical protein [Tanacetum cinerariifolium]
MLIEVGFGVVTSWVWLSVARKRSRMSTRLLVSDQASVRDSFFCWEKAWISPRSRSKRAGEKSANESGSKFIPRFDSSFVEFLQPCFCFSNSKEFINVFMRIGFGFPIKLVSFHESQVVTFDGKFVCGFRNSDYETKSRSNNTVDSPHGFIIHWIVISKIIKEVTEVIDIEDWRIDNSRVLRWIVSLIECNSSVLSTKSSIQSTFRKMGSAAHKILCAVNLGS